MLGILSGVEAASPYLLGEIYDQILAKSFPPEEIADRASFLTYTTWGEVLVEGDPVHAVAVGDYSRDTEMLLLEYLAVLPEYRGQGTGSKLVQSAFQTWRELMGPGAFLAEIERPDAHPGSEEYGDPLRRLNFYDKLGMRALALPYYQRALAAHLPPVPDLLLAVLIEDESWEQDGFFTQGERLAALLRAWNPSPEPEEAPAWQQLMDACSQPIRILPLTDYLEIPRSGPIG